MAKRPLQRKIDVANAPATSTTAATDILSELTDSIHEEFLTLMQGNDPV